MSLIPVNPKVGLPRSPRLYWIKRMDRSGEIDIVTKTTKRNIDSNCYFDKRRVSTWEYHQKIKILVVPLFWKK